MLRAGRLLVAACVLAGCLLIGCSAANPLGTVPVTGKLTYQGQPVAGATIAFIGEGDARPATAVSKADGSYSLMTLDFRGAAPGKYAVTVRKTELPAESVQPVSMEDAVKLNNRPPPRPKELLPAKYGDASKTPLKFEVQPGKANRFDLQLTDG